MTRPSLMQEELEQLQSAQIVQELDHQPKHCCPVHNVGYDHFCGACYGVFLEACRMHPVAWRCRDFGDGWIIFQSYPEAMKYHETTGAQIQRLFREIDT